MVVLVVGEDFELETRTEVFHAVGSRFGVKLSSRIFERGEKEKDALVVEGQIFVEILTENEAGLVRPRSRDVLFRSKKSEKRRTVSEHLLRTYS